MKNHARALVFNILLLALCAPVCADTAVEIFAAGSRLEELGQLEKAARQYERALAMNPGYTEALFRLGVAEVRLGRYAAAEEHLMKTLAIMPGHIKAQAWMGMLYVDTGRYHEGLDWLSRALESIPDDVSLLVKIGDAHLALGRADTARQQYALAMKKDPAFSPAYTGMGRVLEVSGDRDAAMGMFLQALAVNPDEHPAHIHLAGLFLEKQMFAQAEIEAEKARRLRPDDAQAPRLLALIAARTAPAEPARRSLLQALEAFPGDPELYFELGRIQEALNDPAAALDAYGKVANSQYLSAAAHVNTARILTSRGDKDNALAHLNTAVRLDPGNARAHYDLAVLLYDRGNFTQARERYETARALGHAENPLFEVLFHKR